MSIKAKEKGQALILITLAAVGLFAFAALAIDGSRVYSEKRHAQNAADAAAMAGALAYTRNNSLSNTDIENISQTRATSNGYDNLASNDVSVSIAAVPSGKCPGGTAGKDIIVEIIAYVDTTFARIIGRNQVTTAVTATSRACGFYFDSPFGPYAIRTFNPNNDPQMKNCGFDAGQSNSAHWKIEGSGVLSNGCAHAKDNDAVTFDPSSCVISVGQAATFGCTPKQNQAAMQINYPADVLKKMPPNPCDGTPGDIGKSPPASGSTFTNGVYCITDFDDYDAMDITLNNATLYVTDKEFSLKFSGSGGFYGVATKSGGYTGSEPYSNYYMIIGMTDPDTGVPLEPCEDFTHGDQTIEWRGNGSGSFYGTILAPSACLDLRGNGDANGMHTQIIAYTVSSNGNAGAKDEVYINYKAIENHRDPIYPTISVLK